MRLVVASLTGALLYVSVKSLSIGPLPCTTPEGCSPEAPRCIKCPGAGDNTPGYCSFLDPRWQTDLCLNLGYAQFCSNACADRHSISGGPIPAQGVRGPIDSGSPSGTTPGTVPQSAPVTVPETAPGTVPDTNPTVTPETVPDTTTPTVTPEAVPDTTTPTVTPETVPDTTTPTVIPETVPDTTTPSVIPETVPDTTPSVTPETGPGTTQQSVPLTVPGIPPGTPEQQRIPAGQPGTPGSGRIRPGGSSQPSGPGTPGRRRRPNSGGSGQTAPPEEGSTLEVWPTEKKEENLQRPDPSTTPSPGDSPSGQTLQIPTIPTIPNNDRLVPDPKFINNDGQSGAETTPGSGRGNPISPPNNLSEEPSRYTTPQLAFATIGDQDGDVSQDLSAFSYFDTSATS